MTSLRAKILTSYGLSKVALLVFAAVVIGDLYYLQTHIVEGEHINAFYEASQEIRRDEKNLFLYHDMADYAQLQTQFEAAKSALDKGQRSFAEIATDEELRRIDKVLGLYQKEFEEYLTLPQRARIKQQHSIRDLGHELSTLAKDFSRRERAILAHSAQVAGWTLLAALLTVVVLGLASAVFMTRQVVRPLRNLELQLDHLAEGNEQQLTLPSQDKEIQSFVHHFNSMLNQLRAQQNQLRHHEKAAALGVLVSGVAHELNNPLSNISTSVQLLMEDDSNTDPALSRQWLSHIDGESERARRIVRRLLDSVRHPKLHLQAHQTDTLIHSSVTLVERQLPAAVEVHITNAPERTLWVERERIQQVFINLIKNAADAGAKNIWIDADESTWADTMPANTDHLVGDITQVSLAPGVLIIQIEDDGPGIAQEHLAQIFDPFFTTHSAGDGTGLGLYLVEEIISEHHGCIAVENRAEGGTRFSIWLPLAEDQTLQSEAS